MVSRMYSAKKRGCLGNGSASSNGNGVKRRFYRKFEPKREDPVLTREQRLLYEQRTKRAELKGKGFFGNELEEKKYDHLMEQLHQIVEMKIEDMFTVFSVFSETLRLYEEYFERCYTKTQIYSNEQLANSVGNLVRFKKLLKQRISQYERERNAHVIESFVKPELSTFAEYILRLFSNLNPLDRRLTSQKKKGPVVVIDRSGIEHLVKG